MATIPERAEIGFEVEDRPAADVGPARGVERVKWFIVHKTEGFESGDLDELTSSAGATKSAHAYIVKRGKLYFMTPLSRTAWTAGNEDVSQASVNVELEGFGTELTTDAQYRALAAFFRWCVGQGYAIPAKFIAFADEPGIIGHQHVANPNWDPHDPSATCGQWGGRSCHTDPGRLFDWDKLVRNIRRLLLPHNDTSDPNVWHCAATDKWVVTQPFLNLYAALDAAPELFGLPISGQEGAHQYFERARFELQADGFVQLGRLGDELLRLHGRDWTSFPEASPNAAHFFPETRHAIANEFHAYWSEHGLDLGDRGVSLFESIALFGLPISELAPEADDAGEVVPTQFFERAVFRLYQRAGGTEVRLDPVGRQVLAALGH